MMDMFSFQGALLWVIDRSYFLIFLGMLVEGPAVTAAAAFASALGHLSFPIIIALSFLGDIVGDLIYYTIGYTGRLHLIEKYGYFFGATEKRIAGAESYLKRHAIKGLVLSKFLPVIPTLFLLTAGALRMPFRKFLTVVALVTVPRTLLFGLLGFYFGKTYEAISTYITDMGYLIIISLILGAALYYIYRLLARRAIRVVENE